MPFLIKFLLCILTSFFIFINCASVDKNIKWESSIAASEKQSKLQTGDIIIKNKVLTDPKSWFGHSAIMVDDNNIGDFPKPGKEYITGDATFWLIENRKVVVLRYNKIDENFKTKFKENSKKYGHGIYKYTLDKYDSKSFYCSKYVWFVYYKTAQDLGYILDIDRDGGSFVFPYDFIGNPDFHQVLLLDEKQ